MIGLQIPKVIFKTREGDSSSSLNECPIGGKWIDKSTDDYFNGKRSYNF
jgi:Peroxiredoxin